MAKTLRRLASGSIEWEGWWVVGHWAEIDGRPECVGLELWHGCKPETAESLHLLRDGPVPIHTTDVRDLPVQRIITALWEKQYQIAGTLRSAAERNRDRNAETWTKESPFEIEADKRAGFLESRRKSAIDRTHFEQVAAVYADAFAERRNPTATVRDHFHVSQSTATKWVARCRDFGLLPPTTRGRAAVNKNRKA